MKAGAHVEAGQLIAHVAKHPVGTAMLHIEFYAQGKGKEHSVLTKEDRRDAEGRLRRLVPHAGAGRGEVAQRFGAIGRTGSIALIERLWRTLKDALGLKNLRPLVGEDLQRKLELGLVHYAHFRPHQALGRSDAGRGLLRPDARSSLGDPATAGKAG